MKKYICPGCENITSGMLLTFNKYGMTWCDCNPVAPFRMGEVSTRNQVDAYFGINRNKKTANKNKSKFKSLDRFNDDERILEICGEKGEGSPGEYPAYYEVWANLAAGWMTPKYGRGDGNEEENKKIVYSRKGARHLIQQLEAILPIANSH